MTESCMVEQRLQQRMPTIIYHLRLLLGLENMSANRKLVAITCDVLSVMKLYSFKFFDFCKIRFHVCMCSMRRLVYIN